MKRRKLFAILLALSLVFGMSAMAFAADETKENGAEPVEGEVRDEGEGTEEEGEGTEPIVPISAPVFEIPVPASVVVSTQALKIDGELVDVQPYNIDGANYFKLRDLAALLKDTESRFDVAYEAPNMIVTTGEAYTPIDGDLEKGEDRSGTAVPSAQVLMVDGEKVDILVYNIGGNNYFQLRGLGELVGFEVGYDDATRTMLVETE
jgi:hypothetical protein